MKHARILAGLASAALLCGAAEAAAQQPADIHEWPVPYENSRPRDPFVGADGRVWFVGQRGNYLAYLEPASGRFRRYDLEPRALPHNLVVGPDGAVWYAGNGNATIGRLDPATGDIRVFPMPDSAARDPHTLVFAEDGTLWFTVQGGNFVGRMDPASGAVRLFPSRTPRSRPYGIVVDGEQRVWVNLFGTHKLGLLAPGSDGIEEIDLPRESARGRRIGLTSDGAVWYVDYAGGMLGRMDPGTRAFREWALPGGPQSRPYAMTVDDRDRVWVAETGGEPNRMVAFDPSTGTFVSVTDVPSGGGTIRHMVFHAPSREIWFGTDANTIGRVRVP